MAAASYISAGRLAAYVITTSNPLIIIMECINLSTEYIIPGDSHSVQRGNAKTATTDLAKSQNRGLKNNNQKHMNIISNRMYIC